MRSGANSLYGYAAGLRVSERAIHASGKRLPPSLRSNSAINQSGQERVRSGITPIFTAAARRLNNAATRLLADQGALAKVELCCSRSAFY